MKALVCYATLTGNTQMVGEYIAEILTELDEQRIISEVSVLDAVDIEPQDLQNYDLLIMGSSSWGDGEYNPISEDFADRIRQSDNSPSLVGKKLAVFGLGDSIYERFCGAVDNYEGLFTSLGADLAVPSIRIDGYPDEDKLAEVYDWVKKLVTSISKA